MQKETKSKAQNRAANTPNHQTTRHEASTFKNMQT